MSELFAMEQHIKIKGAADPILDTFPFGAHSSAIDSLRGTVFYRMCDLHSLHYLLRVLGHQYRLRLLLLYQLP